MLGDALAGDVAATADAVEQERVVLFAFLEHRAAQFQPGIELGERPGRGVLDQLLVALGGDAQAALIEVELIEVEIHRLRFTHARTVQDRDNGGVPLALWPRISGANLHQFLDQ
ncbi:hypothetical protein D3C81_1877520 [compost metagenome]